MPNTKSTSKGDSFQEAIANMKSEETMDALSIPALPGPLIRVLPDSGLYSYSLLRPLSPAASAPAALEAIPGPAPDEGASGAALPITLPGPLIPIPIPISLSFEELRVDVDGYYPQMKASGMIAGFRVTPAYWIANVAKTATSTYEGNIWYKDGNVALIPQTHVKIEISRTFFAPQSAKVTFTGGGSHESANLHVQIPLFPPRQLRVRRGAVHVSSYFLQHGISS